MENFFDRLNNWINDTEGSLVNFLTAFSPWLAPLAPAYMTFHHMIEFLHFDPWLAWVLAGVVEILGFGTVSTGLDFWFYNRNNKAKKKQAPLILVFVSFGFYLLLIVFSNIVIDFSIAFGQEIHQKFAVVMVRALLTLQTIPAALIVAVRTGHRDLLREIKREKAEKTSGTYERKDEQKVSGKFPKDWRKLRPMLTYEQVGEIARLSASEVSTYAENFDVSVRTVTNWRKYAKEEVEEGLG